MSKITKCSDSGAIYVYVNECDDRKIKTININDHIHVDVDMYTSEIVGIEILNIDNLKELAEKI